MKKVDIKGKPYIEVNERLKFFRENFKGCSLISEVIEKTETSVMIKASVLDADNCVRATGTAEEIKGSTFINKTSYVENCETSAWGRALANFGIGIDTSVASYEEVANAVKQQTGPKKKSTITDARFNDALVAIANEKYTSKALSEDFELSGGQKAALMLVGVAPKKTPSLKVVKSKKK